MKVGDLVEHTPVSDSLVGKIYNNCSAPPDFKAGIVIQAKQDFRRVLPASTGSKPSWYQVEELKILSIAPTTKERLHEGR
jgi:hypothetical protein